MIFEIVKYLFILLIAVPFIYMIYDVTADVVKRIYGFYQRNAKPVLIRIKDPVNKF